MAGLLTPGPTIAKAEELRAQRGSRGLLGAIGGPMSYAPNPIVAAIGGGLLGAQYLTGEKPLGEGLASLSDMTAMAVGSRAPAIRYIKDIYGAYVKSPKKLYRGEGPNTGKNSAGLGYGLYSSPDKKFAKDYGKVRELTPEEAFPKNPLVIPGDGRGPASGLLSEWALDKSGLQNMREFNAKYGNVGNFVKSLGYDGVWAGSEVVKY